MTLRRLAVGVLLLGALVTGGVAIALLRAAARAEP